MSGGGNVQLTSALTHCSSSSRSSSDRFAASWSSSPVHLLRLRLCLPLPIPSYCNPATAQANCLLWLTMTSRATRCDGSSSLRVYLITDRMLRLDTCEMASERTPTGPLSQYSGNHAYSQKSRQSTNFYCKLYSAVFTAWGLKSNFGPLISERKIVETLHLVEILCAMLFRSPFLCLRYD